MNREQENRPDLAEQGMRQNPEDAKAKFAQMVEQARQSKPHKTMAEARIEQAPGSPSTTRELKKEAQMFREQSQDENFSAEQRQNKAAAAEHFQAVADSNEEMVNLRLSQLSPQEQQSWKEEYGRLNQAVENYEERLRNFQGSAQEHMRMADELNQYKKKQQDWEAKLPRL